MDRRSISIKAVGDPSADTGLFSGVLSTYGGMPDSYGDICDAGCYDATIASKGTKRVLLWQHSWDDPIGSFEITDATKALTVEGSFNLNVAKGREAYALLKRGDISGLSIGYTVDKCDYDPDGTRHLKQVDLWEGSLVTFPANINATAEAKQMNKKQMRKSLGGMLFLKKLSADERAAALAEIEAVLADYSDGDGVDDGSDGTDDGASGGSAKAASAGSETKRSATDGVAEDADEINKELGKTADILRQFKEAKI